MFDKATVERLSETACADALAANVASLRRIGAERLALVAHVADLRGPGTVRRSTEPSGPPRVRMVPGGSDGTPEVSEFAAAKLGMLLEVTTRSAAALLRDALDLRHRHPRLWEAVMSGATEDWKARKVAQACAVLTLEEAVRLDAVTVEAVVGLPFGRALSVVEGKVIAADRPPTTLGGGRGRVSGWSVPPVPTTAACGCSTPGPLPATSPASTP